MRRIKQTDGVIKRKNEFDGTFVCGTRDFNKTTARDKHIKDAFDLVKDFFIDPKTGLLHEHMSESRTCPICEGNNFEKIFVKYGFQHVKCECGFILVNPTAGEEHRNKFSKDVDQTWAGVLLTPTQKMVDISKFKYGLEVIERHAVNKGLIVDVGAGPGLFLEVARDMGWRVSAVEFNKKSVENIHKLGIEVFSKPIEDGIYANESADVVTIWDVLEHINNPNQFIENIRKILKPSGLLFICVPNINALVTRILHEKSVTFDGYSHVNFFNIQTLSKILEQHGFEVLETDTIISELGTIKNHISYEHPYLGAGSFDLAFLTPKFLYENDLGSRILMLARKK